MHILFVGGGTAGHINPALAIAGYFKIMNPDCKISYIGTKNGIENKLVPLAGYDFYSIDVAGFQRSLSAKNIKKNIIAVKKVFTASKEARKLLKELNPDIVIGTGGYVSGPVVREAIKLGIKTALHEANAFPGVTIKMLSNKVDRLLVAFGEVLDKLKYREGTAFVTGNPIRQELTETTKDEARKQLNIPDNAKVILSFGGSLGSGAINESIMSVIEYVNNQKDTYIFHGTGKIGYDLFNKNLKDKNITLCDRAVVLEYIHNMNVLLAAADLVICRSGAMTVNELQVCGKASILIPFPAAAENHQFHNAMALKNAGAAEVIEQKDLNGELLLKTVVEIIEDRERLKTMSNNAKKIAVTDADKRIYDAVRPLINK